MIHMNRWILQNKNVSIVKRLRYFESVVSSVACFAGGHRIMHNRHLELRLDEILYFRVLTLAVLYIICSVDVVSFSLCPKRAACGQAQLNNSTRHLERLDTHFRKLSRSIVGPPPGTVWTLQWHEVLHQWNVRANTFIYRANIKTWSHICCFSYWGLA